MQSNISLIKALVTTLHREVETMEEPSSLDLENGGFNLSEKVRNYEAKLIRAALLRTGGNQRKAAALLDIKTSTLNAKIKHHGIDLLKHKPEKASSAANNGR